MKKMQKIEIRENWLKMSRRDICKEIDFCRKNADPIIKRLEEIDRNRREFAFHKKLITKKISLPKISIFRAYGFCDSFLKMDGEFVTISKIGNMQGRRSPVLIGDSVSGVLHIDCSNDSASVCVLGDNQMIATSMVLSIVACHKFWKIETKNSVYQIPMEAIL